MNITSSNTSAIGTPDGELPKLEEMQVQIAIHQVVVTNQLAQQ